MNALGAFEQNDFAATTNAPSAGEVDPAMAGVQNVVN
jgi:hypothetical protein